MTSAGDKRVALVTGTSRGIGRALATFFVSRGFHVVGCSRKEGMQLEGYEHAQLDVADEPALRGWIADVRKRHERIDVAVNNAGIGLSAAAQLTPSANAEAVWRTNFHAAFVVCREVAKTMTKRKEGRIVNLSSVAVPLGMEGASIYTASKAALVQFSRVFAKEVAPFNITCNVVAPSLVETDMMTELSREAVETYLSRLTIKRPLTTDEVCGAVEFFTRPESGCITGQVLTLGLSS